jgi:hypothetical protein
VSERCQAITRKGKQCMRVVHKGGTRFCRFHEWLFMEQQRKAES